MPALTPESERRPEGVRRASALAAIDRAQRRPPGPGFDVRGSRAGTILEVFVQAAMLAADAILSHGGYLAVLRAQARLPTAFRTHPANRNKLLQILPGALGAPRRWRRM